MRCQKDINITTVEKILKKPPGEIQKESQKLQKQCQFLLQDAVQAVINKDTNKLSMIKQKNRRLRKMLSSLSRTEKENYYYETGIYNGIYAMIVELYEYLIVQEEGKQLLSLLEGSRANKVLCYLYENPNARQKEIAEYTDIQAGYLSEILNILLQYRFVERIGKHKATQYYLTRIGRQITRTQIMEIIGKG